MSDAFIDPVTAGYVLTGGTPVRDPAGGLANAVYLRLMTPLGAYWADSNMGSRLHLLQREKDLNRVAILARQYAAQALKPLLDDGRALAVEIETERSHNGRMHLLIVVTDAAGERLTFTHPVQVL